MSKRPISELITENDDNSNLNEPVLKKQKIINSQASKVNNDTLDTIMTNITQEDSKDTISNNKDAKDDDSTDAISNVTNQANNFNENQFKNLNNNNNNNFNDQLNGILNKLKHEQKDTVNNQNVQALENKDEIVNISNIVNKHSNNKDLIMKNTENLNYNNDDKKTETENKKPKNKDENNDNNDFKNSEDNEYYSIGPKELVSKQLSNQQKLLIQKKNKNKNYPINATTAGCKFLNEITYNDSGKVELKVIVVYNNPNYIFVSRVPLSAVVMDAKGNKMVIKIWEDQFKKFRHYKMGDKILISNPRIALSKIRFKMYNKFELQFTKDTQTKMLSRNAWNYKDLKMDKAFNLISIPEGLSRPLSSKVDSMVKLFEIGPITEGNNSVRRELFIADTYGRTKLTIYGQTVYLNFEIGQILLISQASINKYDTIHYNNPGFIIINPIKSLFKKHYKELANLSIKNIRNDYKYQKQIEYQQQSKTINELIESMDNIRNNNQDMVEFNILKNCKIDGVQIEEKRIQIMLTDINNDDQCIETTSWDSIAIMLFRKNVSELYALKLHSYSLLQKIIQSAINIQNNWNFKVKMTFSKNRRGNNNTRNFSFVLSEIIMNDDILNEEDNSNSTTNEQTTNSLLEQTKELSIDTSKNTMDIIEEDESITHIQ